MPSILTLTTDFGVSDGYVGAMKGVILDLVPHAVLVDISHQIPPRDIATGAFVLHSACSLYPCGSVHVAVVDPGVGSDRRGIVVVTEDAFFVGPDNGLFSPIFAQQDVRGIYALENRNFMRADVSATFHGRDVFAPTGAHLLRGVAPDAFGPEVTDSVVLDMWRIDTGADRLTGQVVHVDHFGNAISAISREKFEEITRGQRRFEIQIGSQRFDRVCATYTDVSDGEPLALFGSLDTLEISINGGNAAACLGIQRGDTICVEAT